MAEIVQKVEPISNDGYMGIFQAIAQNWGYIVLAIFIVILAIILWVILKKWEDERKERDDPVYEGYQNLIRDCRLNADKKKIRLNYRLVNLLWFGIPLARKEHSAKIVNYTNSFLGWYRGHCHSQDGYFNILAYKTKFFFFIEECFLIRCAMQSKIKVADGLDREGRVKTKIKVMDYKAWLGELANGDIKIKCTDLQKLSYFRYPVYLEADGTIIDMRRELKEDIIDLGHDQMLARVLATGSQMVEKAMLHNPNVKYAQLSPEKTKVEQETQE